MSSPSHSLRLIAPRAASFEITEDVVMLSLRGVLNEAGAEVLRLYFLTLVCTDGPREIVIDLAHVDSVDAAGAEPLLEAQELQQRRGAVLRLSGLSAAVLGFLRAEPVFARLLIPADEVMTAAAEPLARTSQAT